MTVVVLEYLFYYFFVVSRWTLKNNIYVFVSSFFLFFFTRILESMYVSRSWLSVYNSKCVCVCVWVKKCAVCPLCVLIVYVCLWFQQKCSFVLGKKNLVYFFLSVQLNCLYYWFFCCRCNREMQCIQPTTPPTDRTRPFNTISNSNTKNRLSSSSFFFLLASTNRRRRRHHQHNCTIQLFSRIFCSASSFSGINIIIFRCFWLFVNFFFLFVSYRAD